MLKLSIIGYSLEEFIRDKVDCECSLKLIRLLGGIMYVLQQR